MLPDDVDLVVGVLMDLVKRDEKLEESKRQRLGDKLVKWVNMELEKNATLGKT